MANTENKCRFFGLNSRFSPYPIAFRSLLSAFHSPFYGFYTIGPANDGFMLLYMLNKN
jgi:hypothetical protein